MFKNKLYSLGSLILVLFVLCSFGGKISAQDEAEKQGKEIYEKYRTAIGGKENWDKIKTVETVTESERMGTKYKITRIEDRTNKKSLTVTEGGIEGKQENGFDGKRGWSKSNFFRGYRDNSTNISTENTKYIKLPNEKIDGKDFLVVNEVAQNGSFNAKNYYDPETFLLYQKTVAINAGGMQINQTTIYSDYRKVGDVLVAFREVLKTTNGEFVNQKISVRHNIEVDPKIFEFTEDKKAEEKKTEKTSGETASKPQTMLTADANTIYKDEEGKIITAAEFMQKRSSGNYLISPEVVDGKLAAMRLKKGSSETAFGAIAPDFSATLLDNSPIKLSDLQGKIVVLNFWFAGCAPCIKEVPELNELVKKYEGKEVEFISVTYDPKDVATEFINKHKFNYKHISDAQNIVDLYKVTAYPTHIVLNKEGKIEFTQFGYSTGVVQKISDNIEKALKKEFTKTAYDQRNPNSIVPENIKKETLEKVWTTINNSHFDLTFNGVNWNAVKTKYEAQLANVKTNQNLTDLLNQMVGELKQSHLKVHPANAISINGAMPADAPKTGNIGLDLRLISQSELVVTNVAKDSTAEKAGLKKGYIIKKVDGETVESIAQKQKEKGGFQLRDELTVPRAVQAKLAGNLDKKVAVTFLDENDAEKTIEIDRQSLGARVLDFEFKELNKDVGYIRFNLFFGDLPAKFAEAIAQLKEKKSIIVDIRGNRGGVGNHTTALAAMLDKEKRSLGVSQYRYNKQEFAYEGNDKSFSGKVFILIDEMSASSAEVFAAGLQSHKRATVIGRTSVGAVLPSVMELLPNGGALQYAIADYKTPDGKVLEGRGAIPDIEVKLTRKDLLAGKDMVLEKALNLAN